MWVAIFVAVGPAAAQARWDVFVEPELGTRVDVPTDIFSTPDGASRKGIGRQLVTPDGRAALAVYSVDNRAGRETPASYVRENFKVPQAAIDYRRITGSFFAISAIHQDEI